LDNGQLGKEQSEQIITGELSNGALYEPRYPDDEWKWVGTYQKWDAYQFQDVPHEITR
jgi:hypothetical protein